MRALILLTACAPIETADTIEPLRHHVEYETREGIAELTVHRAFRGIDGELDLEIALPSAAAVDRFRFAHDERWYEGELLEAEAAESRYDLLSGLAGEQGHAIEGAPPPALLSYQHDGSIRVRAHPVAPSDLIEIEYRILLPLCHASGRRIFDYPLDEHGPPTFSGPGLVRDAYDDEPFGDACDEGSSIAGGERLVIELDPLRDLEMTYAVQSLGERTAVRVAIDAPPELAPIPDRPLVLFVLDGSYSQADEGLRDQLAWAKAYLAWVPDADVEVIVFRREAERLFGRSVPARDFEDAIAHLEPALGNGSFLDRGIALAASLADPNRETRIVVISDLAMRSAFDLEAVELGAGVMHVLGRSGAEEGDAALSGYLGSELGELATATGGLMGALEGDPSSPAAIEVVEELVHPIRLEAIELVGLDGVSHDAMIDRGDRMRTTAVLETAPPDRIEVRAKLWSKPMTYALSRSNAVEAAMPAILVATSIWLTEDELLYAAMSGGVVSSMTSYLAEQGGVDPVSPPHETYDSFGLAGRSIGTTCSCGCGGARITAIVDHSLVREEMRALAAACGVTAAHVWIETTSDEIADVSVAASEGRDCLVEAIWSMRLPESYRSIPRSAISL